MAKSDSDSNGLRQDQPECCLHKGGRLGGKHTKCVFAKLLSTIGTLDNRPSVTELPELTSDPIYTADRRGGILISFGPDRMPLKDLNPSRWASIEVQRSRAFVGPGRTVFAFTRNALLHLRASDRPAPDRTGVG
jgi:hypothetical protein